MVGGLFSSLTEERLGGDLETDDSSSSYTTRTTVRLFTLPSAPPERSPRGFIIGVLTTSW